MAVAKGIVAGRIVRELECKYSQSGVAICNFTLAVQDGYGDKEHCSFVECVCFKQQAESLCQYKTKGDMVLVDGRIKQQTWTSKDGDKRSKIVIEAFHVDFLGKSEKRDDDGRVDGAEDTFPPKESGATDTGAEAGDGNMPF